MKKEDLRKYAEQTDWIEDQAQKLYNIALEEYPEQFDGFIKYSAGLETFYIENGIIQLTFEELEGDWGDTHSFDLSLKTFLNEDIFREEQKKKKEEFLKREREREEAKNASKLKKEKEQYERLKEKFKDE